MKFELTDYHRGITDDELIDDLLHVSKIIGRKTVTLEEYNHYGRFHSTTLTRRFGSWFTCLKKANLEMSRPIIGITDEELFEDIERVWVLLGKQPSYAKMRELTHFSIGTYEKRFGGWRNALISFIDYINRSDIDSITSKEDQRKLTSHLTSRSINLRTRFLVFQRDHFKCRICGVSPASDPSVILHVDHIIPWSKNGESIEENLQTLCSKCNIGKSDITL